MKTLIAFALMAASQTSHADTLLSCQSNAASRCIQQIRVYEVPGGVNLETSTCNAADLTSCVPRLEMHHVEQSLVEIAGRMSTSTHFTGDGVSLIHLCGGYLYSNSAHHIEEFFADAECSEAPPKQVYPSLCMTVGQTVNGTLVGVKIYDQPDGDHLAVLETVNIFHRVIVDTDRSTRVEVPVIAQHLHSGAIHYFGTDFQLDTPDDLSPRSPSRLNALFHGIPAVGDLAATGVTPNAFCER